MDTKVVVYCPKCKGEDVETIRTDRPSVERVSMDELPYRSHAVTAACAPIMTYRATCKGCGYARDYSITTMSYLLSST